MHDEQAKKHSVGPWASKLSRLVFVCLFVCLFVCVTPGAIRIWWQKSIGCYQFFNFSYFFRQILGFEPALSPYMHSPMHFAFIPILPSCFTLLSCIWKPYLNIAGSCMWPAVFDGTVRYGRRCRITLDHTCPVPTCIPYRTVPSKTAGHNANRAFKCKITMWNNLEEWVCMRSVSGMHAGRAIVRVRIPGYVLKKKDFFTEFIHPYAFFCLGHQGKKA